MKQGMKFQEVLAQVQRDAAARRDFVTGLADLQVTAEEGISTLKTPAGDFRLRDRAHHNLADSTGIDRRYYQRLREQAPDLLAINVNHWLGRAGERSCTVRAWHDHVRAILSPRYGILDNDGLLNALEPVVEALDATIESAMISDDKMYIKAVSSRLGGEVQVGDAVQAGFIVTNSEVGASALTVQVFVKRLVCANGMVISDPAHHRVRRRHIGRVWEVSNDSVPDGVEREAWARRVWEDLQLGIRAAANVEQFTLVLDRLRHTTKLRHELQPEQISARIGTTYDLSDAVQRRVVDHLYADGHERLWDVINAVTRTGEDMADYDVATRLESLGGVMAHLTDHEWHRLVTLN